MFAIKLYQNPRWSASRAPVINVRPAMLPVIYKGGRARERDGARGGTRERRIERFLTRGERGARGSEEKIAARARARARDEETECTIKKDEVRPHGGREGREGIKREGRR